MTDDEQAPDPSPALLDVKARAEAVGLTVELRVLRMPQRDIQTILTVIYPRTGDFPRRVHVFEEEAEEALSSDFENLRFIEGYRAVYHPTEKYIVAVVLPFPRHFSLRALTGAVELDSHQAPGQVIIDPESDGETLNDRARDWEFRMTDEQTGTEITIGSASGLPKTILSHISRTGANTVLRISGLDFDGERSARQQLEELVQRLSFDMDVLYGMTLRLPETETLVRGRRGDFGGRIMNFPKNKYEADALRFYHYGRRAEHLPLLEFLAYYQTIEFFFPSFANEVAVNSLRTAVKHPRFDPNNDRDIEKLLSLSGRGGRSLSEEEQLKAAVRGSVSTDELTEFLRADDDRWAHMTGKAPFTKAKQIAPDNKQVDIRDQFATRVYDIRCRIVHTKSDGAGRENMLLPSSKDAKNLGHDIVALRYLAQQVLVARAARS